MTKSVHLTTLPSGVRLITLDQRDKKVNLLSESFMRELNDVWDQAVASSQTDAVVLVSGKDDNFIAGADVNEIRGLQHKTPVEAAAGARFGKQLFAKIESAPFMTVVGVRGTCMGGGVELTLPFKRRVVSRNKKNKKTKVSLPEVKLGFLPGWGATARLPHIVGVQNAITMVTTGAEYDAETLWKIGFADEVVDPADLIARCEQIALGGRVKRYPRRKRLAANLAAHCKVVTKPKELLKLVVGDLMETPLRRFVQGQVLGVVKSLSKGYIAPLEAANCVLRSANEGMTPAVFDYESDTFGWLSNTRISRNLVGIFCAEQASKRMFDGIEPSITIEEVGVLGAGVMGARIAEVGLFSGYRVVLKDVNQEALDKGVAIIRGLFDGLVEKGKLSREDADAMLARLHPTLDYKDMANCDLVVEAVAEVMYVKKLVRFELENVIKKRFIFATNTSSLSVGEMAKPHVASDEARLTKKELDLPAARYPELIVGVHFFNPAHIMPLVELGRGATTSDEALAIAQAFTLKLGKKTVLTADRPGFIVNRILAPYMLEAIRMFEDGVAPELIDKAMRNFGMAMGPLELIDEVGHDIAGHVLKTMKVFGKRMTQPAILVKLAELKLLGKKGGKGIYLFTGPDGKKIQDMTSKKTKKFLFNPDVIAAVKALRESRQESEIVTKLASLSPTKQESLIQDRLVMVMVNEAARCMEEGIVSEPWQLDMAMIYGTGFPPFHGGVLRYADQLGAAVVAQKLSWLSKEPDDNYAPSKLIRAKAESLIPWYRD